MSAKFTKRQRQLIETTIRAFKAINADDPRLAIAVHRAVAKAIAEPRMRRALQPVRAEFEKIMIKQMEEWCRLHRASAAKEATSVDRTIQAAA